MENPNFDTLPQIVWLKGDEPYFESFSLNADEAMDYLNIKRSRLTQISGKELRVGKARIDRYTRALYRKDDLDEYLAWTRPTAAHQKSMEIVEKAATRLDEAQDQWALTLARAFEDQLNALNAMLFSLTTGLGQRMDRHRRETQAHTLATHQIKAQLAQLCLSTKNLKMPLDELSQRFALASLQQQKILESLAGVELRQQRSEQELSQKILALGESMVALHHSLQLELRESMADLRQALQADSIKLQELCSPRASKPRPARSRASRPRIFWRT